MCVISGPPNSKTLLNSQLSVWGSVLGGQKFGDRCFKHNTQQSTLNPKLESWELNPPTPLMGMEEIWNSSEMPPVNKILTYSFLQEEGA